jgi:TIR domain
VPKCCDSCQQVARIVLRGVAAGKTVEIDGLGIFYPDARRGFRFVPRALPQVFIAYAKEDEEFARRLYEDLNRAGFNPWMDVRRLLAGQNWPRAIETAIESSDFFVACFSGKSVRKKGGFQSEIRYALDCARQVPLDEIYIVPVRLDECAVPRTIQHELQYIDLFPDWEAGMERLLTMLRREVERRRVAPGLPSE